MTDTLATVLLEDEDDQSLDEARRRCCYFQNLKCYPLFRGVGKSTLSWLHSAALSMIVLLLAAASHFCFYKGQTAYLYQFQLQVKADDVVINAKPICDLFNLPINTSNCNVDFSVDSDPYVLLKLGYWDTVKTIWNLVAAQDYYLKGWKHPWETRLGACLVFAFSGVWPHLKLVLLQITWYVPMPPKIRRSFCFWLDMFGKWSLLDVLMISITVAIFDLSFHLEIDEAVKNLVYEVPPLLESTVLTTYNKTREFGTQTCYMIYWESQRAISQEKCDDIMNNFILADIGTDVTILQNSYQVLHANNDLSGTADVSFKAVSQSGVYWFSAGVTLSLLAGVFVDIVDDLLTARVRRHERNAKPPKTIVEDATDPPLCTPKSYVCGVFEFLSMVLGILFAVGIFYVPTIQRRAKGPLQQLVTTITNTTIDKSYNLIDIVGGITSGGGGNPFLQKDSIVFLFAGPVLLLCGWVVAILVHRPYCAAKLSGIKDTMVVVLKIFATASAWEVLVIAELVIMLEAPTLTSNLLDTPYQLFYVQWWLTRLAEDGMQYGIKGFDLELDFTPWWFVLLLLGGIFVQAMTFVYTLVLQRDSHHTKGSGDYRMSTHIASTGV